MNMSRCISSLKLMLGLYNITLPFKDSVTGDATPVENVIRDVLVQTTIPIYSQFQPWIRELDANVSKLKVIDRRNNIYMLPAGLTVTPIMYILAVTLP